MTYTVMNGIDNVRGYQELFQNKRIGIITNRTGMSKSFEKTVDILSQISTVTLLFAPEHGIRGERQAGEKVDSYFDEVFQLDVVSLYGDKKAPSKEELENIDMIVYDIQDIGSRYYTYIYTLYHTMRACGEYGVEVVVLDRVPIVDANKIIGNSIPKTFESFIGMLDLPNSYGMTSGELARYFKRFYIESDVKLSIIPISGWNRSVQFFETDLTWNMPSPNIPTQIAAFLYQGTCLFEGTNISEGRGTTKPFEILGAPWMNAPKVTKEMNQKGLPGVYFIEHYFTPCFSKYEGVLCHGIEIIVTDKRVCEPLEVVIELLHYLRLEYPETFKSDVIFPDTGESMLAHLAGGYLEYINPSNYFIETLYTKKFIKRRQECLIYK